MGCGLGPCRPCEMSGDQALRGCCGGAGWRWVDRGGLQPRPAGPHPRGSLPQSPCPPASKHTWPPLPACFHPASEDGRHAVSYELGWRRLTDPGRVASRAVLGQLGDKLLSAVKYVHRGETFDSLAFPTQGGAGCWRRGLSGGRSLPRRGAAGPAALVSSSTGCPPVSECSVAITPVVRCPGDHAPAATDIPPRRLGLPRGDAGGGDGGAQPLPPALCAAAPAGQGSLPPRRRRRPHAERRGRPAAALGRERPRGGHPHQRSLLPGRHGGGRAARLCAKGGGAQRRAAAGGRGACGGCGVGWWVGVHSSHLCAWWRGWGGILQAGRAMRVGRQEAFGGQGGARDDAMFGSHD